MPVLTTGALYSSILKNKQQKTFAFYFFKLVLIWTMPETLYYEHFLCLSNQKLFRHQI